MARPLLPRRAVLLGALSLVGCGRAPKNEAPTNAKNAPVDGTPGRVSRVISGHGFVLEDGRNIRLGSIEAPRMAYENVHAEPLALAARDALAAICTGHSSSFSHITPDRFSRLRAQVFVDAEQSATPIWVQGMMVKDGYARVRTWSDDHALAADLLALEDKARAAHLGLWAEDYYAVRAPQSVSASVGSFQIVQGRIIDVAEVQGRIFLNFGVDWRKDFTVSLVAKHKKVFAKAGIVLAGLSGVKVRVRGFVRYLNGPNMTVDHPQALEVLAD